MQSYFVWEACTDYYPNFRITQQFEKQCKLRNYSAMCTRLFKLFPIKANNKMGAIGNKAAGITVNIPQAQIDNRFDSLGVNGLSRLMNRWLSSELDALDAKLMSVCRYQKKKYLNLPLFLEFFPNLRKLRQNIQRLYFDFFDLTSSSYVTPKELVGCLSIIMFVPKQLFGQVVLANVFFRGVHRLTDSDLQSFMEQNKYFQLAPLEKKVIREVYFKEDVMSMKDFSLFVATHYNVVKYVRLFDFYDTNLELDELTKLKTQSQDVATTQVTAQARATTMTKELIRILIFEQEEPRIKIRLKRGTIVYLISTEWFFTWIRYIQIFGCTEVVFQSQTGEENRFCEDSLAQQLSQHWISRPPRINNFPLLGEYEQDLKPGLQIYKDFIPIPEGLWNAFQKVYGGGPEIRRVYPELNPMVIYKVSLSHGCYFKNEVKRKMHLQSSAIERVFDPDERAKDPDGKIYVKKIQDFEWSEMQKEMVLMNRSLDHGFVIKVPQKHEREFLDTYSGPEGNKTIQYGARLSLMNSFYTREQARVMSTDNKTTTIHYIGKSWRCDNEFKNSELVRAIVQENYQPTPMHTYYGLPTLYEETSNYYRFMTPVLQCLISTPYFNWYLQRKKFMHALGEPYRQKHAIVAKLSIMAQRFKVKKEKGDCTEQLGKVMQQFFKKMPKYIQYAEENIKVFPNEFLCDFLASMAEELSVQQCLLQAHPRQGMTCLADQKFPIIPKFFSVLECLKTICDDCKTEQIAQNELFVLSLPVSQDDQILYEAIFRSKLGEFTRYAIRIRKSTKFREYVMKFSKKIKVEPSLLAFAQIQQREFRKHFGQSDYESTLLLLGLNETDKIYIFEMDPEIYDLRHSRFQASTPSQRTLPSRSELMPHTYVDFNIYSDWQVGKIKSMDRDKATVVSYDGEAVVDFRRIRNFKEKTKEKPLFRIDVLHRKYSHQSHKIEYFFIPSIISVGEWMTWDEVIPLITKEAEFFFNPEKTERERTQMHSKHSLMNISQRRRLQPIQTEIKYPFRIRIMLNNYGEICYLCEKKIKISATDASTIVQQKYCKGCELNGNVPIGLVMNLRKVCFTVDWQNDFVFDIPEKITEDQSYMIERAYVDKFSSALNVSLRAYSEIGVKVQIKCPKCQYTQGVLKRFVERTPNILILHLNRFKRTKDDYVKFHNKIDFPERLSLSKITLNSDSANDSYQLYGLIGLIDNDVDRGTWYSVFQRSRGVWVYSERETAVLCDLKDIKNNEVYMLFYRKMNVEGTLITTIL